MFIVIFIFVFSLITAINNKVKDVDQDSADSYEYDKQSMKIIGGIIGLAILLQIIIRPTWGVYPYFLIAYAVGSVLAIIISNQFRMKAIDQKREYMNKIYEILQPLIDPKKEGLDFNNIPFELGYEKGELNRITVPISEPGKFNDNMVTNCVAQMNKYLPTCVWISDVDFADRKCNFKGTKLPPWCANYPDDDLRPTSWMPLGVNGVGELGWNIGTKSKLMARSCFKYEDGSPAGTVDVAKAPQALVLGSPLGLDTIVPTNKGYSKLKDLNENDIVFDIEGNPTRVLGKSPIMMSKTMYKITIYNGTNKMIIESDGIHKFPTLIGNEIELLSATQLYRNRNNKQELIGNQSAWTIISIEKIPNQLVMCIKVDSSNHLFLITGNEDSNWINQKDKTKYKLPACGTHNTGGGKAIFIDQHVQIIKKN